MPNELLPEFGLRLQAKCLPLQDVAPERAYDNSVAQLVESYMNVELSALSKGWSFSNAATRLKRREA